MTMAGAAMTSDEMLGVATRLFEDFDMLPLMVVLSEMAGARVMLRDLGLIETADAVEAITRAQLRQRLAAA